LTAWNVASTCGCRSAQFPTVRSIHQPILSDRQETRLDPILSARTDNLATVKLQRRHTMLVLDRLQDSSRAKVPDLL
jgi:hypothetical protein